MNKIEIFNDNFYYIEFIQDDFNNLLNNITVVKQLYFNVNNLSTDKKLINELYLILLSGGHTKKKYYFFLSKIALDYTNDTIKYIPHQVFYDNNYYSLLYNIHIKNNTFIINYFDSLPPKVITNLIDNKKFILNK
jgi:hypothetical protein